MEGRRPASTKSAPVFPISRLCLRPRAARLSRMRSAAKYCTVFTTGLQNTFVYRWNFLLRSLFEFVPLIGTVFIWRALFEAGARPSRGTPSGR